METLNRLFELFTENLFPMFAMIGIGFAAQRKLKFDLRTLNKANIYIFIPGLLLDRLLEASIPLSSAVIVAIIAALSITSMLLLGRVLMRAARNQREYAPVAAFSGSFPNTGNFGIPLMGLFFGPEGVFVQSILLMVNNLMVYSVGVYALAHKGSMTRAIKAFLRIPVPYIFVLALVLRALQVELPKPIGVTIGYLGDGLIPVALITLGAQLAETKMRAHAVPIGWAVGLRLIISPLVTALIVYLFSLTGLLVWDSLTSRVLIVNAAIPAAVNTVIVSMEFKSHPEVAAGAIFVGTLLSALTLSVVLWLI